MTFWQSFKAMPALLKFFTAHAFFCSIAFVGAVIPNDSVQIDGRAVSFAELWRSGVGPFMVILGAAMPATALLMLGRKPYARQAYLAALSFAMVVPYLVLGDLPLALFGVAFVALVAWYMFGKRSAREYFASNNAFHSDGSRAARENRR